MKRPLGLCVAVVLTVCVVGAQGTRDAPIPHATGQSVSPSYEGWYPNPDGTFSLSFGYFNRNYEERLDIPVGAGNRIEPGPADRGQPTHFLPRRQTGVFVVVVPADFGDQQLTWILTAYGETVAIPGRLRPEWQIDALREVTSGNTPPALKFTPDGSPVQGPGGLRASMDVSLPDPATITLWAADDGVRKFRASTRPPRLGLVWSKYRGPGAVSFSETTAIQRKVAAREMPPWHIDKTVGIQEFQNDMSLSDEQIATIVRWAEEGAKRGNPADMPPPVQWPASDVWLLSDRLGGQPPDLVVTAPPWTQAAEGQDQWYQPLVETGLTEDRWVRGVEVRPSIPGRRIVHHALANLLQEEELGDFTPAVEVPGRGAFLTEFAVGKIGDVFRENTGKLIKAGAQISYDIHYHSVGEEITDQTDIGLWFYPRGIVPKYRVYAQVMGTRHSMATLDIPPGEASVHHAYIPLALPARLENYQPHMHVRGKAMSMEAIYPDGRTEMLSHVANFDFNWHVNYVYTEDSAPVLPKGTIIHLTAWHDNTASNAANPDPTQWIGWGQRSFDDMYHAHVNVTYLTDEDYEQILEDRKNARQTDNQ